MSHITHLFYLEEKKRVTALKWNRVPNGRNIDILPIKPAKPWLPYEFYCCTNGKFYIKQAS